MSSVITSSASKIVPFTFTPAVLFVNGLSLARAFLVVPLMMYLDTQKPFEAFVCVLVAANLDWMDGFFARRWNAVTRFGVFADPIADKMFFLTALVALYEYVPVTLIVVILALELFLVAHRVWVLVRRHTADVSANGFGKVKAILQNVVVCALIFNIIVQDSLQPDVFFAIKLMVNVLLYVSVFFASLSALTHIRKHIS